MIRKQTCTTVQTPYSTGQGVEKTAYSTKTSCGRESKVRFGADRKLAKGKKEKKWTNDLGQTITRTTRYFEK